MSTPVLVLLGFAAWTLLTLFGSIGVYRWQRILTGRASIAEWRADVPQGNEWYQRAMRAHMNCVENLPIYTAVVVALVATHMQSATIDRLAVALMIARVAQTFTHIALPPNECRHQPSIWVLLHSGSVHDRNGCHDSCGRPFMMREQSRGNSSLLLPLLAQSGHPDTLTQCPLSGVKRTSRGHASMSASDPKRTSPSSSIPA
jgi:uncharacterized MAPEG superfamily protein